MNTESNINFHKLIEDDVSRIENGGSRIQRRRALEAYYESPNICKHCGSVVIVPLGKKIKEARKKIFCSHSCAASCNNVGVRRNNSNSNNWTPRCDKETFIEAYKKHSDYSSLARALGYKSVRKSLRDRLRLYMSSLGLVPYPTKIPIKDRTKGDLFNIRANWQSARSDIQNLAREIYARSDRPKKCFVCGYDKTYEVAHIKAVADFDDNALISEINDINNLVALCPNHHWEYDNNLLSNEEIAF